MACNEKQETAFLSPSEFRFARATVQAERMGAQKRAGKILSRPVIKPQTTPCASMACATLRKPAMFAPAT